jgi:hypothetical protein
MWKWLVATGAAKDLVELRIASTFRSIIETLGSWLCQVTRSEAMLRHNASCLGFAALDADACFDDHLLVEKASW